MKDYEFISYEAYPDDQYVSASCKLRVLGRFIVVFLQKKTKNGSTFWASVSSGTTLDGVKKYHNSFKDPLVEDEELTAFIQANVKRLLANEVPMSESLFAAASGVAANEQLPF